MHQMGWFRHPKGCKMAFFVGERMAPVNRDNMQTSVRAMGMLLAIVFGLAIPPLEAQSGTTQTPSQPPANSQSHDIPDAPSVVQPPAPKPVLPPPSQSPSESGQAPNSIPFPGDVPNSQGQNSQNQDQQATPHMPPVQTIPSGSGPRNQINPQE